MEEVSDRLIGHVDSGIGEGLDEPGLVPREAGAQAVGARTGMLVEPVKRRLNVVAGLGNRGRREDIRITECLRSLARFV